jgi:hypothetical protein
VGYLFGSAHALIADWFSVGSVVILAGFLAVVGLLVYRKRKATV